MSNIYLHTSFTSEWVNGICPDDVQGLGLSYMKDLGDF